MDTTATVRWPIRKLASSRFTRLLSMQAIGNRKNGTAKRNARHSRAFLETQCGLTPATIDSENTRATLDYPDACAIGTPCATFNAARFGRLATQTNAAGTTQICRAEVVLEIVAGAGDIKALIPVRRRIPTTMSTLPIAIIAITVTAIGFDETSSTTVVHPNSAAINAPVLATAARR